MSRLYKELAQLPVYTSAYYLKATRVLVTTSIRDHVRNTKRTAVKHVIALGSDVEVTSSQDSADALASVPSPSGRRLGVLREVSDGSSKKRFVEVWLGNQLEASKEVTKTHDDFHINPLLFTLSFSKSETSFVYCAEAKAPEAKDTPEEREDKFRYIPDFGERLNGKKRPTLYLFTWNSQNYEGNSEEAPIDSAISVVPLNPSLPEGSTFVFGQASFSPDEKHIFATGYPQTLDGRRLGPAGCWNHPSSIFKLTLPEDISSESAEVSLVAEQITSSDVSARSPRVSDSNSGEPYTIVWLENKGPAHASATALLALRSDEIKPRTLVDYVHDPRSGEFPGLYVDQLPSRPFLALDPNSNNLAHIITHSFRGSYQDIYAVSLDDGRVWNITTSNDYSWIVAGTNGRDRVLAVRSSLNSPPELLEGTIALGHIPSWRVIDKPVLSDWVRNKLKTVEFRVLPVPNRSPTEVITINATGGRGLPAVTIPHGGPHVAFTTEFNASNLAISFEGYLVNLVNYTGSLGFGQKHVDALIGRAGDLDVKDCYEAIKHVIGLGLSAEGPGKQFVLGGSHGGFIGAHLIGQYPDFFSAASMRNPVIAAGEIASVSDIPDWAYLEFGVQFGTTSTLLNGVFDKLQNSSPIAYIDKVKAPVLLLVGEVDRRVPSSQARNYYHALKGRGKNVKMLVFPGNGHGLDSVEAELVSWEGTISWFKTFVLRDVEI
ncbi:hypothetical protein M422DRAFT_171727 [Sphaerobolus stellatus SS14]|uniref:acylaminoacyl-peptidase n=1 Tax=Sphaerobolus stellatus (strain SS14) TaxID=990650 RepID=A0A0C9V533_SPHS4|nr:hypothetical protein M422DRAFT_171727 [Sphaerobolus stellatus SS14]